MVAREIESAAEVSPPDRFALRELLTQWNRNVERADMDGLRGLSGPGVCLSFEGRQFAGTDALDDFVATFGCTAEVTRRIHINHLQAWHEPHGVRARSFAMVVELVAATSPFGVGAAAPAWLGYSEDRFGEVDGRTVVLSRDFHRWGGDVLSGFSAARRAAA